MIFLNTFGEGRDKKRDAVSGDCDDRAMTARFAFDRTCLIANMTRELPPQTPRRSRRFQPLATPFLQRQKAGVVCQWEGEPVLIRPVDPDFDLMQEERETREEEGSPEEEEEETLFYTSFRMKRPKSKSQRGKPTEEESRTFRVGDTITVETDTLYRQKKPPSIAVIVSMWAVRKKVEEEATEHDSSKMRFRVHWFLRPSELAAIREKREHAEVSKLFPSIGTQF